MRCFTVTESRIYPFIPIVATPYPHIGVGEEGRGRAYYRLPVAQAFVEMLGEKLQVERACVLRSFETDQLLLVDEKDPEDDRILLLADIAAGFRGGTSWTGAKRWVVPCPDRGKKSNFYGKCIMCGAIYEGDDWPRLHPEKGEIYKYEDFPSEGIRFIAKGYKAQGAAGRMGGHDVYLLIMSPKASFRVLRFGRLYGEPEERYVMWDGKELHLGTRDEVWPPVQEVEGELL